MFRGLRTLLLAVALAMPASALAADNPAAENPEATRVPDIPAKAAERQTPIAVEYEGNDSLGSHLATRIKESFNGSNLFNLTERDTPKFRVLLSTVPEFPSRPGVGSAYAVVWVFSQSEATLRHFLLRDVGVVTADEVNALAAKIVERTDALAIRYGYLFQ